MLVRPRDRSGERAPYFERLQAALRKAGIATPTLIIDQARLNANVDSLMRHLPAGMAYRAVVKSLPALGLLDAICQRAQTDRVMTFNLPMLLETSQARPTWDQLLGKPLPVRAARTYFDRLQVAEDARRVQWLVDTPDRLAQYAELADGLQVNLRINLEIDIGLHRGGFSDPTTITHALETVRDHRRLQFSGLMGYEPHVAAMPNLFGLRARALRAANERYRFAKALVAKTLGEATLAGTTMNGAGSPTYRLYEDTEVLNEVSVGSALVKPTDFDTDLLTDHQPASFIAAPVYRDGAIAERWRPFPPSA